MQQKPVLADSVKLASGFVARAQALASACKPACVVSGAPGGERQSMRVVRDGKQGTSASPRLNIDKETIFHLHHCYVY